MTPSSWPFKIDKTQLLNGVFGIVCAVASLSAETDMMPLLPDKWKHYVSGAAVVALWIKGHWNYWTNPNGTPATTAYVAQKPNPAVKP
jgi:hypothetical protein